MKIERHKKKFLNLTEKQSGIYLIHHMHHFKDGRNVNHELHHCFLYSQKNESGERISIIHKIYKNDVFHCISKKFSGILYDHQNNSFHILPIRLNNKMAYEIKLEGD